MTTRKNWLSNCLVTTDDSFIFILLLVYSKAIYSYYIYEIVIPIVIL